MADLRTGTFLSASMGAPAEVVAPRAARALPPSPTTDGVIPEGIPNERLRYRERYEVTVLVLADVVAVGSALVLSLQWLGVTGLFWLAGVLVFLTPLLSKGIGLYDRDRYLISKTTLEEVPKIFHVATFCTFFFWLLDSAVPAHTVQPDEILKAWIGLFTLMVLARAGARAITRTRLSPERCLVLGPASSAAYLESRLSYFHASHAAIVGRVPFGDEEGVAAIPVLGDMRELGIVLAEHDIERVILVPPVENGEVTLDATRLVRALGVRVSILPRLFEVVGSAVDFDNVSGVTLLGLRQYGLSSSSYALKRAMDLIGASVGLVVLSPLIVASAIAIKLDSRGPILFRQCRIGKQGRRFEMLKFRTMVEDAASKRGEVEALNQTEGLFKLMSDPRVTRIGAWLRATSVDELPQLLNVLRGEMSLVGPRPLVPEEDEKVAGWQRRRLLVPPGMTGHWQILGSTRVPLQEMTKIDYLYGANWSLWGDIKTLVRTIPHVLGRKGV